MREFNAQIYGRRQMFGGRRLECGTMRTPAILQDKADVGQLEIGCRAHLIAPAYLPLPDHNFMLCQQPIKSTALIGLIGINP